MKVRVALGHYLSLDGVTYSMGEELDIPDDAADAWQATGLVVPADGDWPHTAGRDTE